MKDTQIKCSWSELQRMALNRLWKGTKSEATASINTMSAVEFFGAEEVVKDLSVQQIDLYVESLLAKKNTNGTINRKLSALSKMLRFALDRQFVSKIPKIDKKKESSGRVRWLTKTEEQALVGYFNETNRKDLSLLVIFLLDTGARAGEALSVTWKDIANGSVSFWCTKNGSPRSVPLTKRLRDLLTCSYSDFLASNQFENPSVEKVFKSTDYSEFNYLWQKAKKALGFGGDKQFVPHCLRHTCASRLAQAGVPIITIKEFMGHKNIQVTMRYAHLTPNQLDRAREALEGVTT